MKIAIIAVAAIVLASCAATRVAQNSTGEIRTGSVVYNAQYAAERGLTQAQTAACERQGRIVWARTVGGTAGGMMNNLDAGLAYEKCVRDTARKVAGK